MSWVDNLIDFMQKGESGHCPKCGSKNVKVKELSIGRGSVNFECVDCGSFAHFDKQKSENADKN